MKMGKVLGKTVVNKMIKYERLGYPPNCAAIFHQPERPSQTAFRNLEVENRGEWQDKKA